MQREFKEPGRPRPDLVIGREELFAGAREQLARGGSVLVHGSAGIGKSTVLRALAAEYEESARTVLRCSATESESHLPFLALTDLLGLVLDEVSDQLPAPQRTALESALTGRGESTLQRDGLALRLAVLSTLRALAAKGPVLIVADDLQWLDPASVELLGFAARRLGDLPVRMLCAVRTSTDPHGHEQDRYLRASPPDTLALRVTPLSRTHVAELLENRGYTGLPRSTVRDIHRTSGGNPLFALELGRALADSPTPPRPGEPLPVPTSLRTLVLNRLDMLSAEARRTLLVASAGARPTGALLHAAGRENAEAETAQAVELGLLAPEREGPYVRFAHPLVSAALYAEATAQERRAAHAALSTAAVDPIERARHLALATHGTDPLVAARLGEAAAVARDRGAPSVAAELGLLSARHTPADATPGPDERRLQAAEDALTAGENDLGRDLARDVLSRAADPAERVRAWMVVIDAAGQSLAEVDAVYPQVLADAGDDPRLLGLVRYQLAWRALVLEGDFAQSREEAARAAELASRAEDRRTELLALAFQAQAEILMGHRDAPMTIKRALKEPQDPQLACHHNGAGATRFRWLMMSDQLGEARATITSLLREVRRRGMVESEVHYVRFLAETELRSGHCGRALDLAREGYVLARDSGIGEGASAMLTSLTEAAGGDVEQARALAREAADRAEQDGDLMYLSRALGALGHAQLVAGDAPGTVQSLRRVRELEEGLGINDPARGRWHGDLAEALVRVGELAEAQDVIDVTRQQALRLGRESVLAVLDRGEALVRAARGEQDAAVRQLMSAQDRLAKLGYGLEEARAAYALAGLRTPPQALGLARPGATPVSGPGSYDEASRLFRRCRALPWLRQVEEASITPAPPQQPAIAPSALDALAVLAATERQVAELVMEGATNREIAGRLYISVKTVEATLTRVYRKLGIRSRVDIVRLAAGHRTN
ncbi:AAA family ATPase [Streptomyces europaeiscabiei]|uniref:helix-turn-helix transcriptional regulator n=1 Tax=Streptomyces TaxID=1883 RepID=UPI000A3C9D50|nr:MULTISPECIES: LuxR family transcriptional regulator [Streptomyces]MDX3586941.1 AAA family ATPase [Streptomyces europaeiscabiei]MDX3618735.1 AAA family ATPase [Streptomyces europaeiscabiei]MDX3628769.1 AAA family ATPase [Streptomyces europaeiscabiei]MDX3646915.1 AAA family ATPase [Streptomyces europaeiscabiei]WUD36406.1 AAA family ATPase [Streptomyces europaeiscabiei]